MKNRDPQTVSKKLEVMGLIVAATGILILFLTNSVTVPAVAVGPILLLAAAALVAVAPWRWTPLVGLALALFILVGAFIAPGLFDRLGNPAQLGGFLGTWVQIVGLVTALAAGTLATMQNYQARSRAIGH